MHTVQLGPISALLRLGNFVLLCCSMHVALSSNAYGGDYVGHELQGQSLVVKTKSGSITLSAYSADAIEVVYDIDGVTQLPSFAIGSPKQKTKVTLTESAEALRFSTPTLTATVQKNSVRISYSRNGVPFLEEEEGLFTQDDSRGFRFKLKKEEKLMGGGQRVLGMNRRGHVLPLDNRAAYGYSDEADAMYYGIPAVLSDQKYLLLFDNSARGIMDLGEAEPDIMQFQAKGGRTAYIVFSGDSYMEIVENYVSVTGKQEMPPRWAFGNFASRFGYRSSQQARDIVQKFADDDIPLDAIIFDLFWFGPDIKGHMGNLAWDRDAFPNPEKMISDFKSKGVNTILITEPFILTSSNRWKEALDEKALALDLEGEPKQFDFYFGTSGLVDVFDDTAAHWLWGKNKTLLEQGVEGIWGDLGEPEAHPSDMMHASKWTADEIHNVYGHEWAKLIYQNHVKDYPEKRPFIMMRSGFAGSQRYGMIPWSGDVARKWGALQAQIEIGLQMSILGLAYSHSDLGGFVALDHTSDDPDAIVEFDRELYIRWLQFGAFQPVFRPHSQEEIPSEPVFFDKEIKDIVRRYIKLRYRLLPYLYTLSYQNSESGTPLMRPLLFADENNTNLFDYQSAFLWGDDVIVAPVTQKGATEKSVYLTDGIWFDLNSDAKHQGGREITVPVSIEDIPVFVRAGSFLPMIGDVSTTANYTSEKLSLHYYHDASVKAGRGLMYEDDGHTRNAKEKGLFEILEFTSHAETGHTAFIFKRQKHAEYSGQPDAREIELIVHNWESAPEHIKVGSTELDEIREGGTSHTKQGYTYSADTKMLRIYFDWNTTHEFIELR